MTLSAAEQYLLELINRARLDPLAEAQRYHQGLNAGLAAGEIDTSAKQVLAPNAALDRAATAHSAWMLQTDSFSHSGAGGSNAGDRMSANGYQFTGSWAWRENLAWLGSTGSINMQTAIAEHHAGLYRSPSHRVNTFAEDMREIGIGQVSGSFTTQGRAYNSSMLTEKFAMSGSDVFVTGVAYRDADRNGFYGIGEGQSGVWVRSGNDVAATAAAGGYGLGLDAGDTVRVAVGQGQRAFAALDVDLSDGNVKLDVVTLAGGGKALDLSGSASLLTGIATARLLGSGDLDLAGHNGANWLHGNSGNNAMNGGGGVDRIWGNGGHDRLDGGAGNDWLWGGAGNDTLIGDTGNDVMRGGIGNDRLFGGTGRDWLVGEGGGDVIWAGPDNDRLFGDAGADMLFGEAGNDWLYGGLHNDYLDGGAGNDRLQGGPGADRFVFAQGRDAVVDFTDDVDTLLFRRSLGDNGQLSVSDVLAAGEIVNGHAVFDFGGGDRLTVLHVSDLSLLANDIGIL